MFTGLILKSIKKLSEAHEFCPVSFRNGATVILLIKVEFIFSGDKTISRCQAFSSDLQRVGQVTRGHNSIANKWAGVSNPHPQ